MKLSDYLPIILDVLKSPIVIGTVIVMLIVISFAKYVCTYTKKPSKKKAKKNNQAASQQTSQSEPEKTDSEKNED